MGMLQEWAVENKRRRETSRARQDERSAALSPVPRVGADSNVRSFIEWNHATGMRFRCHVLRECHARGAVGKVGKTQGLPPYRLQPSLPLNNADKLINRASPRLGQGYLYRTGPELRARVAEALKEAGHGTLPRRPRWLGVV